LTTPRVLRQHPRLPMPPSLPDISDADLDEAKRLWDQRLDPAQRSLLQLDPERRSVLRCKCSTDIRACPGSGKTTLLVVKLGILAAQWPYHHRGVCVLSHTNVARREVEKRLAQVPALRALTSYPHFVGTVQLFLHQFLANPGAIECFGARPTVVENAAYEIEATRRFSQGSKRNGPYAKAAISIRIWMQQNPSFDNPADYASRYLEYRDADLALPPLGAGGRSVGWSSETGIQLRCFKESLSRDGYFRFQDMAALAAWYAKRHPGIARPLQERFPIVFFDEMQDTVAEQGILIKTLFAANSVVQRFGDDRQAIFHSSSQEIKGAAFPEGTPLSLRTSFRLSPSIAHLAENICAESPPEVLVGDSKKPDHKHTLFVFSRGRAQEVLPEFCKLVIAELGPGLTASDVKAVGAIARSSASPDKFPRVIGDYWPPHTPRSSAERKWLKSLDACFDQAAAVVSKTKSTSDARSVLLSACARMLRLQNVMNGTRPFNPSTMVGQLGRTAPEGLTKLNTLLATTILDIATGHRPTPVTFADEARAALLALSPEPWNSDVTNFTTVASSQTQQADFGPSAGAAADNVYRYPDSLPQVSVRVDTIHSVKGETLRAVLVFETLYYEHDLKLLISKGYLHGGRPAKTPGQRLFQHLKRVYVAMTRPTDLLCLAVLDSHLGHEDRDAMRKFGWHIEDIC